MEQFKNEIWKDIPGYEGLYQVSNYGRCKSLSRKIKHSFIKNYVLKESILSETRDGKGYIKYMLRKNGKRKAYYAHSLVALVFISNKNGYNFLNHIDKNKTNNYYKNLEWVNHRENISHRYKSMETTSNLTGVFYDKRPSKSKNPFIAGISINGKRKYLGSFNNEESAHKAYLQALKSNGIKNKYAS